MTDSSQAAPAEVERVLREIGEALKRACPPGVGFCVILADIGDGGFCSYLSNVNRGDMHNLLLETIVRTGGAAKVAGKVV